MIQEQRNPEYRFIKGDYASIKIKMEPQSLLLDVPLDWQINKIKCLLTKMLVKLQFDMFHFHHDNQEIPGSLLLKELIQQDSDQQCISGDYYVLNFEKRQPKQHQFENYYIAKMKPLIKSLESSPFQPILHPAYYNMKYLNHINHIPFEGGRQLIVNFNHLQQMQNVIHEQRRGNENVDPGFVGGAFAGNLAVNNQRGGGFLEMVGTWIIRFIQIFSIITILRFLYYYSNIEVFITIALITIAYFVIDCMKPNKKGQAQPEKKQNQSQSEIPPTERSTVLGKIYYKSIIALVEIFCLSAQCFISYTLSLFPNWTVQLHREWFKGIHDSIDLRLRRWKLKINSADPDADTKLKEEPSQPQNHEAESNRQPENDQPEDMENSHEQ